jgi:hypothetical protein
MKITEEEHTDITFLRVGSAFRSWCDTEASVIAGRIVRGSAFRVSFAGEEATPDEEDAEAANIGLPNLEGESSKAMVRSHKRSRAATETSGKRDKSRCEACGKWHPLPRCWLAVEALRPVGWNPPKKLEAEFERMMRDQKEFARRVEMARKEHMDHA